ncbi:MAG: polyprenyl synthetase family protein [Sedimentisphaerales bacterium]|nr:polyprenyl synthetase family protein [Sedimentisphaerales bacterium]
MESPVETSVSYRAPWREIPSFKSIDALLSRVNEAVRAILSGPAAAGELAPLLGHLSARPGKMIRPGLLLLSGRCLGPTTDEHIKIAAIVEMIHHATLLHDDVIDDGQTRRGAATVNRVWGNESAVLLGDFVLSQVFRLVADLDPAVARVIGDTAARVCEGELRQVVHRHNWRLSEDQYLSIITEKSAAFFSGCCRLGALLAGAAQPQIELLARFGLHAGIAFQITDDLLDVVGDERDTGKTPGSDLGKSKLTLAVIHLIEAAGVSARDQVCELLENPRDGIAELKEMLVRYGSLQYTRARALDQVRQAEAALESISAGESRDALVQTAHFMADRTA